MYLLRREEFDCAMVVTTSLQSSWTFWAEPRNEVFAHESTFGVKNAAGNSRQLSQKICRERVFRKQHRNMNVEQGSSFVQAVKAEY